MQSLHQQPFAKPAEGRFFHSIFFLLLYLLGPELCIAEGRSHELFDADRAGSEFVIVGQRGAIFSSKAESFVESPTSSALTAVERSNQGAWYVAGHDATILTSSDDGLNWKVLHQKPEGDQPLFDLWLGWNGEIVAVGAYGLVLKSLDGGQTWLESRVSEEEPHLYSIDRIAEDRLLAVGEFGSIYISNDIGASWQKLPSPYEGSFFGFTRLKDGRLLLFGLRGHLYISEASLPFKWKAIETGVESSLLNAVVLSDHEMLLVGLAGTVLKLDTTNLKLNSLRMKERRFISDAIVMRDGQIALVGENGIESFQGFYKIQLEAEHR